MNGILGSDVGLQKPSAPQVKKLGIGSENRNPGLQDISQALNCPPAPQSLQTCVPPIGSFKYRQNSSKINKHLLYDY